MGHIPLLRLVIPFITGIILWLFLGWIMPFWIISCSLVLILIIWRIYTNYCGLSYDARWIFGVLISFFLIAAGYQHAQNYNQINFSDHFSKISVPGEGYFELTVTQPISEKEKTFQVIGWINKYHSEEFQVRARGKIILYLQKDSLSREVRYGDVLIIKNQYFEPSDPKNPGDFNYKAHLASRNIFHQSWLGSTQWIHANRNDGNKLKKMAINFRDSALENLRKHGFSQREHSIIAAMVLGYRDELDAELKLGFSRAGAMHVLCVSGLHVGIIFLLLDIILGFLARIRKGPLIRASIIVCFIWAYATITGLSPSVMRAAAMFSFIAAGQALKRKPHIFNTLSASAFVLLIIDPYVIMNIGFQLSYSAVIGIITIHSWLNNKIQFQNPVLDKIWGILTVSVGAQAATAPIIIYYFNQFPNFFLLTNLFVIPLASIIIYLTLIVIILTPLGWPGIVAGKILGGCTILLNEGVGFIEKMPYSFSDKLFITSAESLLLLSLVMTLTLLTIKISAKTLVLNLIILLFLTMSFSYRSIRNFSGNRIIVYHSTSGLAIDFINHGSCISYTTHDSLAGFLQNSIFNYRLRQGIKQPVSEISQTTDYFKNSWLFYSKSYINACGKSFYVFSGNNPVIPKNINTDYLILTGNPLIKLEDILDSLSPGIVISDATNNYRNNKRWETICRENQVEFYSISSNGAFIAELGAQKDKINVTSKGTSIVSTIP
jgi:competence protein ComEC